MGFVFIGKSDSTNIGPKHTERHENSHGRVELTNYSLGRVAAQTLASRKQDYTEPHERQSQQDPTKTTHRLRFFARQHLRSFLCYLFKTT